MGIGLIIILIIVFLIIAIRSSDSSGESSLPIGKQVKNAVKGRVGEMRVELSLGSTLEGKQYVINNLVLNVGENKTSQIDHILINRNGVFVIETKNYEGRIYGSENQHEWTQVLAYGHVKNKFYNPIKQNNTHAYHVSRILTDKLPIIPAVVFVKANTQFIKAQGVYTLSQLKKLINQPSGNLTVQQMRNAYNQLINADNPNISKNEHVNNIRSMQSDIAHNICPRCGKKLVLRNGKYGEFYGCSGYPQCKFIKK